MQIMGWYSWRLIYDSTILKKLNNLNMFELNIGQATVYRVIAANTKA